MSHLPPWSNLICISFDCPLFAWVGEHLCHVSILSYEYRSFHPSPSPAPPPASAPHLHLPENDTVLPLSASCYLPMYLHQNCIATLLEFSSSGMPVSVLCRDHEYTATYTSIVNLQMRRLKQKGMLQKKKKRQIWKWVCRCAWHLKAQWSHIVFDQHVIISIWMHTAHDGDPLNPDMTEGISVSEVIVTAALFFSPLLIQSTQRRGSPHSSARPQAPSVDAVDVFSLIQHRLLVSNTIWRESFSRGRPFHPVWPLSRCHNGKRKKKFVSPLKLSFFFSPDHFSTVCRHWGVICPTLTHSDWSLFFDKSIYCHPPLFLSSHSCSF